MNFRLYAVFFAVVFSTAVFAQDMSSFMSRTTGVTAASFDHSSAQINEQRFSLSVPVYRSEAGAFALTTRMQRTDLGVDFVFPASSTEVPREFGEADFGGSWNSEDSAGNKAGVSANYGEAGTKLFGGGNAAVLNANGFVERKKTDHSWMYFLSYSNNRTILNNIPLPGFAYGMYGATYTAAIGLPFAFVNWRPDPWMLTGTLSPFGAMVEPSYRFWGPLQAYLGLNWSPKSYANVIPQSDDRLLYDKKEISSGLRMNFGRKGSVSLGLIRVFGRKLMIGKSIRDDDAESVGLKDFSGVQLKMRIAL